jgi:hypothetical protein
LHIFIAFLTKYFCLADGNFEILTEKINDSDLYGFAEFNNDVPVRQLTGILYNRSSGMGP